MLFLDCLTPDIYIASLSSGYPECHKSILESRRLTVFSACILLFPAKCQEEVSWLSLDKLCGHSDEGSRLCVFSHHSSLLGHRFMLSTWNPELCASAPERTTENGFHFSRATALWSSQAAASCDPPSPGDISARCSHSSAGSC